MVEAAMAGFGGGIGDMSGGIDGVINGTSGAHVWNNAVARNRVDRIMKTRNISNPTFSELRQVVKDSLGDDMHYWFGERARKPTYEMHYRIEDKRLVIDGGDYDGEGFYDTFIRNPREDSIYNADEHELKRLETLEQAIVTGKTLVTATSINRQFRYIETWQVNPDGKVLVKGYDIGLATGQDLSEKNIAEVVQKVLDLPKSTALDNEGILFAVDESTAKNFFARMSDEVRTEIKPIEPVVKPLQTQKDLIQVRRELQVENSPRQMYQLEKQVRREILVERKTPEFFVKQFAELKIRPVKLYEKPVEHKKSASNPLKDIAVAAQLAAVWWHERKIRKEALQKTQDTISLKKVSPEKKLVVSFRELAQPAAKKIRELVFRVRLAVKDTVNVPTRIIKKTKIVVESFTTKAKNFWQEKIQPAFNEVRKNIKLHLVEKSHVRVHKPIIFFKEFIRKSLRNSNEKKPTQVFLEKRISIKQRVEKIKLKFAEKAILFKKKTRLILRERFVGFNKKLAGEMKRLFHRFPEVAWKQNKNAAKKELPIVERIRLKFKRAREISTKIFLKPLLEIKQKILIIRQVRLLRITARILSKNIALPMRKEFRRWRHWPVLVKNKLQRFLGFILGKPKLVETKVTHKKKQLLKPKEQNKQTGWVFYIFYLWLKEKLLLYERPPGIAFGSAQNFTQKTSKPAKPKSGMLYNYLTSLKSGSVIVA